MSINFKDLIESIKDKTDIIRVIGEHVDLNAQNKALCPFHDEKTPSFSVNPNGQYFHCFGCGVGGDVFRFLELMGKKTFKEVFDDLARRTGVDVAGMSSNDIILLEEKRKIENILLLAVEFYSNSLTEKATNYLINKRGFTKETISRFQIGYANGGLREYLLNECGSDLELCLKSGVLSESEDGKIRDHFYRRIIFPNFKNGRVVHLSGRLIDDKNPKYLHLPGTIEYLYNEDALNEKSIIIAEGIPDCISANQAGYPAVAVLGTSHFNEKHKSKFSKCDTVYICMDGDEAGRKAAHRIGEILADKAIMVQLPEGVDINEYLKEHSNDDLQKLLDDGKPYIEIEIEAIKNLPENRRFPELNALLPKLKNFDEFKRSHYRNIISKEFKIDKRTIDKGIDKVPNCDNSDFQCEQTVETPSYTNEEKEKAIELLNNENLIEELHKVTEKLGCVGEINNKLIIYLTLTSRILEDPINLIVKGDSSGGKSFLVEKISQFFPKTEVLAFSTITPKALYHRPDDLSHKALIIFERSGAEDSDYSIRTLQSEKKLVISMSVQNPETKEWETKDKEIAGPIAYIETTTKTQLHPENETRCFEIFVDDSENQTEKIHQVQRRKYSLQGNPKRPDLKYWIVAQQLLKPYPTAIPFVEHIKFPTKPLRVRRDFQRFLTLIEVSAVLHQYQRAKVTIENIEHVVANYEDYAIAFSLASTILQQTIKQISPKAEELIRNIKKLDDEINESVFTRRQIEEKIKWERKTVVKYLRECVVQGFIDIVDGGRGKAYTYKFVRLPDEHDNLLIHPNDLRELLDKDDLSEISKLVHKPDGQVNPLTDNTIGEAVQDHQSNTEPINPDLEDYNLKEGTDSRG